MDSVAEVQLDLVFKHGDEQHDSEAQQDASVLQQEEATVADAVFARVVVQHLWHLGVKRHEDGDDSFTAPFNTKVLLTHLVGTFRRREVHF